VDSLADLRGDMSLALNAMALVPEVHHHEVATAGQCEIGVGAGSLVDKADQIQVLKYVVHNVAFQAGKTATFMPKPLVGDNGNWMHVHQSLVKKGKNLFAGKEVGGISKLALHYIAGIIKHARALNAFTNASTNSYRRLVPGFEAPTTLTYSARNRSASIRIPFVSDANKRRIEVRFPDSTANPYLAFVAMMLAGLDGIQNELDPGKPVDKDLYALPEVEEKKLKTVAPSLDVALDALDKDRKFLTQGGVMTNDLIDAYIGLKMDEVTTLRQSTHPVEFQLYYSV
jgi:glutamine synthetase